RRRFWRGNPLPAGNMTPVFGHLNGDKFYGLTFGQLSSEDFKMSPKSFPALLITAITLVLFLSPFALSAQTPAAASANLPAAEIERIIKTFTAREGQFRRALNQYSFKRDAVLQSLGMGGQITG